MFLFGKNKKEKKEPVQEITKEEYCEILKNMEEKELMLEKAKTEDSIPILNDLGSGYMKIGEIDKAIYFYEIGLTKNRELGKAYTDLMRLYNIKRRIATEEKDDENMKLYMEKIEELMKLSKDVIRGKT